MKSIRILSIAAVLAAFAPLAHAWDSPEVGLVLNYNSTNGGYSINRYDPSSGQFLGSYAQSSGGFAPSSIQQVGNTTHEFGVDAFGNIVDKQYNFSTGQFLKSTVVGSETTFGANAHATWMPGQSGNGAYIVEGTDTNGYSNLYDTDISSTSAFSLISSRYQVSSMRFDPITSTLGISVVAAAGNGASQLLNAAVYYSINQSQPSAYFMNEANYGQDSYDGTNGSYAYGSSLAMDGNANPLNSVVITDDSAYSGGVFQNYYSSILSIVPSTGFSTSTISGVDVAFSSTLYSYAAFGHQGNLYVLEEGDGTTYLEQWNSQPGQNLAFLGSNALTGVNTPLDFQVYAAPEPASLLALAPLAIGLISRRRRR